VVPCRARCQSRGIRFTGEKSRGTARSESRGSSHVVRVTWYREKARQVRASCVRRRPSRVARASSAAAAGACDRRARCAGCASADTPSPPTGRWTDMELGHWVTGSMGHLGRLSRPGHRVITLTRCETRVFPVFEKCPKCKTRI